MGYVGREVTAQAFRPGQLLVLGAQGTLLRIDALEQGLHFGIGRIVQRR